ncbi:50S ribosomal protein L25/general stress protein Ctc [Arthrobacter sp. H5]|uniref:50S ribosomal protein L25/general stress protein Ctc n=1 Tax=Arthrobacter sp. H5 TaxID=1267973 RepID=UPI0004815438|nr:50S ribosomal protein L25/general stress protein Ctc [Arthrobacter sp. H5]
MSEQKLGAELRTDYGKGAARQARRAEKIPAVIYGHGADPIHILLPAKATTLALRQSNALLTIDVEGETHLALAKDIQRNPIKQIVEHIDLLTVRSGEKVIVDVYIHIEGELAPGAVMNLEHPNVSVESEATHIPEYLTVNIEGHTVGEHVYAKDIALPKGTVLLIEDDTLIINITSPTVQDLGEDEETEGTETAGETAGDAEDSNS